MIELRRPALLESRRHDREQFDSGEAALDEWLRRYASQNRRRDTAATWVVADADDHVVAYARVAMTGIDRSAAPEIVARGAPDPVPALLLGRLAVDRRYANRGIGTALVAHVLATAVELNEKAACRTVVVTALNTKARSWWERLGFHPFEPDHPDGLDHDKRRPLLAEGGADTVAWSPVGGEPVDESVATAAVMKCRDFGRASTWDAASVSCVVAARGGGARMRRRGGCGG